MITGWNAAVDTLDAAGRHDDAALIRRFAAHLPPVQTAVPSPHQDRRALRRMGRERNSGLAKATRRERPSKDLMTGPRSGIVQALPYFIASTSGSNLSRSGERAFGIVRRSLQPLTTHDSLPRDGLQIMTQAYDPLLPLRGMARQLIFRTGHQETPISLGGTYFLLEYQRRLFAITARHVVRDAVPEQLLLAVSDTSLVPARILHQFNPTDEDSGDFDLVVYLLDIRHLIAKHRHQMLAYELSTNDAGWLHQRYESTYFFFGFPLAYSDVDYGRNTTQASRQQHFFVAKYRGSSRLPHCHVLELSETKGMADLNGMSGSPVFAHPTLIGVATLPRFAGVLLRGSATGGLAHFLESQAIKTTLDEILRQAAGRLPRRWRSVKTKKRRAPRDHT